MINLSKRENPVKNLNDAMTAMHDYYVGKNDDPEGFLSDLAILITNAIDDADDLAADIRADLELNQELDGEDE